MLVLVTGATGLVGNAIARRLVARGDTVRALVRDPESARRVLPEGTALVRGDVTDLASVREAARGVALVFHAAGMPEQWQRDEGIFDRVNRGGTVSVLRAARESGVERVVYTSTMDVFAAPPGGTLVETNVDHEVKPTAYERSKQAADREVEAAAREGLDVVSICPSAVYGPSPSRTGLNALFVRLLAGKVPMLPPGGMSVVYVDGVADAHLAAARSGERGARYLVSDCYVSNREFGETIARIAGLGRVPPSSPMWLLGAIAATSAPLARIFGFTPLVAPGEVAFLRWQVRVDARKAQSELGFVPTALEDGVRRTVESLRSG
ncbi:MAG: NAD-dependent epimerase/dehydratase family protein [Deltaproteobacteria bacterium]|nr:NAD-dependent epimerase/dehydratase family protein [Deltaproteobacteria bacterium]